MYWQGLLSVINVIAAFFGGGFVVLGIELWRDRRRQQKRRRNLLRALLHEMEENLQLLINVGTSISQQELTITMPLLPLRDDILRIALLSDVLDPTRDTSLFESLSRAYLETRTLNFCIERLRDLHLDMERERREMDGSGYTADFLARLEQGARIPEVAVFQWWKKPTDDFSMKVQRTLKEAISKVREDMGIENKP